MPTRLLAFAILLQISTPARAGDSPWVPLSIDAAGGLVAPVTVNGQGPFRFLLDTGSSHSVMSEGLAARLGLTNVAKTFVLTSTGRELRPVVRLDQTTIGTARTENLLASVVPAHQLAAVAGSIEGVIGQDFLFDLNYTLDYRRRRLTWNEHAAAGNMTRLPLVAQEGRYLVQIGAAGRARPLMLVPDSGSNGFVIYARDGRTGIALEPASNMTAVHSLSGRHDVRAMVLRRLTLGEVTIRDQPVAVIARSSGDAPEGDGLLPLHLFDSVSFNARERYLTIRRH